MLDTVLLLQYTLFYNIISCKVKYYIVSLLQSKVACYIEHYIDNIFVPSPGVKHIRLNDFNLASARKEGVNLNDKTILRIIQNIEAKEIQLLTQK